MTEADRRQVEMIREYIPRYHEEQAQARTEAKRQAHMAYMREWHRRQKLLKAA